MKPVKTLSIVVTVVALLVAGMAFAQNKFHTPQSVLHVITVKWKADATDAQKQAALDGVKKMASAVPGITNVWVKTLKVQPGDYNAVIAMEFKDAAAFQAYADPVRQQSTTHDVTN